MRIPMAHHSNTTCACWRSIATRFAPTILRHRQATAIRALGTRYSRSAHSWMCWNPRPRQCDRTQSVLSLEGSEDMQTLTSTDELLARVVAGGRLSLEEGMRLYQEADDEALRRAADQVRQQRHPEGIVTYLVDRNINYTNVCIIDCGFCAFYRKPASPEGYLLSNEVIGHKIEQLLEWGGSRILLQGGVHPYLKLDYYESLLRYIKEHYPTIQIDGFSPVEVWNIARIMKLPLSEILRRLHVAGLDGLPGGGAEILDNRTRQQIAPHKGTWESWIEAERLAQREGLTTSATMVFGFGEALEERVLHLTRLRELQDESLAHNGNG